MKYWISGTHWCYLQSNQASKTSRTNGPFSSAVQSSRSCSRFRNWNLIVKSFFRLVHISLPIWFLLTWLQRKMSCIIYSSEWTCAISGQTVLNSISDMEGELHSSWNINWVQSKSLMCWWCGNTFSAPSPLRGSHILSLSGWTWKRLSVWLLLKCCLDVYV